MARIIHKEPSRTLMEYRLLPRLTTAECTADRISLRTPLVWAPEGSRQLALNIPIAASAMQSVSGPAMAVELARLGGVAFIFCSQTVAEQAAMVSRVKQHKAGFVDPTVVGPDLSIAELDALRERAGYSTYPVVDGAGTLLGLITRNDYNILVHAERRVRDRMIPRERLVVGAEITDLAEANRLLMESHHSVLPIVDGQGRLRSLVFRKDIEDHLHTPDQVVDENQRLLAAAAVNTHDYTERVPALVEAGVDVIAIDSSDGFSHFQAAALDWLTEHHPELPVIGGNVITGDGFDYLVDHGARAVKVGMGGGSICITQEQKGTGRGLATSIQKVAEARDRYRERTGRHIPVIADGGIGTAKDITIALALGADYVMMGRYFARMEESPTEKVVVQGRVMKPYWGEGAARAREWKAHRYHQATFVEGVEGFVDYAGRLRDNLEESLAKIRASFSSCGCADIPAMHRDAELELVSALSIREGQVHDILLPGNETRVQTGNWGD